MSHDEQPALPCLKVGQALKAESGMPYLKGQRLGHRASLRGGGWQETGREEGTSPRLLRATTESWAFTNNQRGQLLFNWWSDTGTTPCKQRASFSKRSRSKCHHMALWCVCWALTANLQSSAPDQSAFNMGHDTLTQQPDRKKAPCKAHSSLVNSTFHIS